MHKKRNDYIKQEQELGLPFLSEMYIRTVNIDDDNRSKTWFVEIEIVGAILLYEYSSYIN